MNKLRRRKQKSQRKYRVQHLIETTVERMTKKYEGSIKDAFVSISDNTDIGVMLVMHDGSIVSEHVCRIR
jgi:hypothetical protein